MKKAVELVVNHPYLLLILAFNDIWDLGSKLKQYFNQETATVEVNWLDLVAKALTLFFLYFLILLIQDLKKELINSKNSINLITIRNNELKEDLSRFASRERIKSYMNDIVQIERWKDLDKNLERSRGQEQEKVINETIRQFPHVSKSYIDEILKEIYGGNVLPF